MQYLVFLSLVSIAQALTWVGSNTAHSMGHSRAPQAMQDYVGEYRLISAVEPGVPCEPELKVEWTDRLTFHGVHWYFNSEWDGSKYAPVPLRLPEIVGQWGPSVAPLNETETQITHSGLVRKDKLASGCNAPIFCFATKGKAEFRVKLSAREAQKRLKVDFKTSYKLEGLPHRWSCEYEALPSEFTGN